VKYREARRPAASVKSARNLPLTVASEGPEKAPLLTTSSTGSIAPSSAVMVSLPEAPAVMTPNTPVSFPTIRRALSLTTPSGVSAETTTLIRPV
jgi:hypothetical protein